MYKRSDVTLVVMVLMLLGASIAVLYGRKVLADQAVTTKTNRIILEHQDTIDYLQPYLISGGMHGAAAALSQFALSVQRSVLTALMQGTVAALTDEQKIELLGALLVASPAATTKAMVMPMLYNYFQMQPIFTWLLASDEKAIPMIIAYDQKEGSKRYKNQLSRWINRSAAVAIMQDEPELLTSLIAANIRPEKKQVNKLLEKVVTEGRSVAFIPLLIEQLGGDPNYSPDKKQTLLIIAVQKNNIAMVKALLLSGAQAEKILDKAVGSARQVAFERGFGAIELLLQKKGGK